MCGTSYVSKHSAAPVARPRWGLLYGVVFVGLAALTLVDVDAAAPVRTVLDGVMAGAVFFGIACWIRANRVALDQQNWCECAGDTLIVRVITSRRPDCGRSMPPRVSESRPREEDAEVWATHVTNA